ncbi:MAG TPA: hypothetical protein VK191_09580 [Symbiobacteriaceae bacterium]|nr:hypothetical protein [Symbiobacteriaceae bacterium]
MRKHLLTTLLLASLVLTTTGAQAADPPPAPGESAETALAWAPGTTVTWPTSGQLWLAVSLEAGRSVGFTVPKATEIDLHTKTKRAINGQCAVAGDLTCTFLPSGTGGYLLRLTGPAGEEATPLLMDGKTGASAYEFGAIKNQRWAIPAAGSAFWQVEGRPTDSVWAFTVPGASKLTLWDGTTKLQEESGSSLRFTASDAATLTLEVQAPRSGYYGPFLWAEGSTAAAGYTWDVSTPKTVTLGATRTAWIRPSLLLQGRTTQLLIDGKATLSAQTTAGRYLLAPCDRSATSQQCRLTVPEGESVALRLSGDAGTTVKLTALTGTAASPFQVTGWTGTQRPFQIEPAGEASLSLTLPAAAKLHLRVPGATHLALTTDPAGPPVTADGEWLTATIPTAGTYSLAVTAGPNGLLQVQRYLPGELPQLAVPFEGAAAPFTTTIGARKVTWVRVSLQGGQTYQFQSPVAIAPATLTGRLLPVSARRQGGSFNLPFTPEADGDYLIRLSAPPGSVTLTMNGLAAGSPISATPDLLSHLWTQTGSTVWLAVPIPAAGRWGISVPGAAHLTLRQGATEVAQSSTDLLQVTAPEPGTYTVGITAGRTGTFTPTLVAEGGIRAMALTLPSAGLTTKISANGSLWLAASGFTPGARFTLKATSNPGMAFSDANEKRLAAECGTAGSLRICSVTVPADGKLWIRLIGPASLTTNVTLQTQP